MISVLGIERRNRKNNIKEELNINIRG